MAGVGGNPTFAQYTYSGAFDIWLYRFKSGHRWIEWMESIQGLISILYLQDNNRDSKQLVPLPYSPLYKRIRKHFCCFWRYHHQGQAKIAFCHLSNFRFAIMSWAFICILIPTFKLNFRCNNFYMYFLLLLHRNVKLTQERDKTTVANSAQRRKSNYHV